jgi:hypothetical protein
MRDENKRLFKGKTHGRELLHNSNEPGGKFTFGMKWNFTSEDDEPEE